jgi:uncharacterized protein involved in exopolysaccharide biosynthesis
MIEDRQLSPVSLRKISLQDLIGRLRRGRLAVLACTIAGFLAGLVFLLITPVSYTVQMAVAPPLENMSQRESVEGGALAAVGLASLVATVSPEPFRRYENMLQSQAVATKLQKDHHILQLLLPDRWDAKNQKWLPKTGLKAVLAQYLGRSTEPGIQDVLGFLSGNVSVTSPAINSPIRQLSLRFRNAEDAGKILMWLHEATDSVVRTGTRERTQGMIKYLKAQLPVVDNADERQALSRLLVNREQDLMLLTVGLDFSAVVLDPPNAENAIRNPRAGTSLLLSIVFGLGLGLIVALAGIFDFLAQRFERIKERLMGGPRPPATT